jgi:hypothetical protein
MLCGISTGVVAWLLWWLAGERRDLKRGSSPSWGEAIVRNLANPVEGSLICREKLRIVGLNDE